MGSDATTLADMAAYWVAYDLLAADDTAGQRALQKAFLLAHGGRVTLVNGKRELVGGIYPVRV